MTWFWTGFFMLVLLLLALDLGFFNRKAHLLSTGEALAWSAFWGSLTLAFNFFLYQAYGRHWLGIGLAGPEPLEGGEAAVQFFTAYLVERSLSLDNIFFIAMTFSCLGIPARYQNRILLWGVLGALLLRGSMILGGVALIEHLPWTSYLFGLFLLVTAVKLLLQRHENVKPEKNPLVRLLHRVMPVTGTTEDERFFVRRDGKLAATPLLPALLLVVSTDLAFAVDTIPAALAVTRDPFLIYTSNVFAVLGLRSLYFALASTMGRFRYFKLALVAVLVFVGAKMLLIHAYPIPPLAALTVILLLLLAGLGASLLWGGRDPAPLLSPLEEEFARLQVLTLRHARRVLVLLAGGVLLLVGAALLFLPGPGIPILLAGLALLATEFLWARRWFCLLREKLGMKPCQPAPPRDDP